MMLILSIILSFLGSAHARDLPEFPAHLDAVRGEPFAPARVKFFRIQVFPHQGAYTQPEGKESNPSLVEVTSATPCVGYEAIADADQEWTKGHQVVHGSTQFTFKAGSAQKIYFSCRKPFVIRRQTNLKAIPYSGDFVVITSARQVKIINVIAPDEYLKGVIPSEVEANWPAEVLKAQAIAARTYAWWSVLQARNKTGASDMDDTVSAQAYLGNLERTAASDLAATQTEGLVMKTGGENIIAYFSDDSGGYTESAAEVFEPQPYCKARRETYNLALYPRTDWTKTFTLKDLGTLLVLAKLLNSKLSIAAVSVRDEDRTSSGRAGKVMITDTNGNTHLIEGCDFRYATKLRSNLFTVAQTGSDFLFAGAGFGHGVGMAQVGALEYAKQFNWTAEQILNFYYTGINIVHE